jgi:hypothetical protein
MPASRWHWSAGSSQERHVLRVRLVYLMISAALSGCGFSRADDARMTGLPDEGGVTRTAATAWTDAVHDRFALERAAALRSVVWPKQHAALNRLRGPCSSADVPTVPIRKVLLIGASTMQWAVGRAIERRLGLSPVIVSNSARSATGLARPDHHDWFVESLRLLREQKPDLVIVQFGGNDCQSLFAADGTVVVNYDARQRWRTELFRRMGELVFTLRAYGARVVLLDLQPMESRNHHRCVAEMNQLTERVGVAWQVPVVSVQRLVGGPNGEYVESSRWLGRDVNLRAADGLHLTRAGGEIVAHAVVQALQTLPGWPDALCERAGDLPKALH